MAQERLEEVRASLEVETGTEGFGLRAVHRRIRILFGSEYGLSIESMPDVGTRVIVRIPMQTADESVSLTG